MERHLKTAMGKMLRKEFALIDDLPYPMRKALEELGAVTLSNDQSVTEDLPHTRGGNGGDPVAMPSPADASGKAQE